MLKSDNTDNEEKGDKELVGINSSVEVVCTGCGALFTNDKWTWNTLPDKYENGVCPSCTRIKNSDPAGQIIIRGTYFSGHKNEIIQLIQNISSAELSIDPLERLMEMCNGSKELVFKTSGVHLARKIGNALQLAFDGELITTQTDDEHLTVHWNKNL